MTAPARYTARMVLSRPNVGLVLLLCLALLFARAAGAHLHLCFDGQEAPSSLHLGGPAHAVEHHLPGDAADAHGHAHAHDDGDHTDRDLPLFDHLLGKTGKTSLDLPALLFALLLLGMRARAPASLARGNRRLPRLKPPDCLRPPLRGPPLPAS